MSGGCEGIWAAARGNTGLAAVFSGGLVVCGVGFPRLLGDFGAPLSFLASFRGFARAVGWLLLLGRVCSGGFRVWRGPCTDRNVCATLKAHEVVLFGNGVNGGLLQRAQTFASGGDVEGLPGPGPGRASKMFPESVIVD